MFSQLSTLIYTFPEDQLRYLSLFIISFPLALVFRRWVVSRDVILRHLYHFSIGLAFGLYCFHIWENVIFLSIVGVAYLILIFAKPSVIYWYMLVYSLLCVLGAHSYCMYRDYGGWKMTFTGPLMVMVQKLTYVSCELLDGTVRPSNELSEEQNRLKIDKQPSLLEFFSYSFSFVSFLAGPTCSYKEYSDYINGTNMKPLENPNRYAKAKEHSRSPSPLYPVLYKCVVAFSALIVHAVTSKYVTQQVLLDGELTILLRLFYTYVFLIGVRSLYYFSFIISEAICNTSGLGFHGYDERGVARWDLLSNVDIKGVEFGINFRQVISSWHIMTALWLRRCIYERVTFSPTGVTFLTSAIWHGIYPGYHLTFLTFFCITETARKLRSRFHNHFQSPPTVKLMYDIVTTILTGIARDWSAVPFVLLTFNKSLTGMRNHYFIPLIVCVPIALLVPSAKRSREKAKQHKD